MRPSIHKSKGQSLLEYSVLIIVVAGVLLGMYSYLQRGIQGRHQSAAEDLGDQYDPRTANSVVNYVLNSTSNTLIDVVPVVGGGFMTKRTDTSNSTESKSEDTSVNTL